MGPLQLNSVTLEMKFSEEVLKNICQILQSVCTAELLANVNKLLKMVSLLAKIYSMSKFLGSCRNVRQRFRNS